MNPNDPNVVLLELVAQRLGDLRQEFVFVDVDLIVQVLARPDYYDVEERLRQQGFGRGKAAPAGAAFGRWYLNLTPASAPS